ncbi:hypothetical protein [Vibrio cyclitrophicus]|uniref:hypothetical protein n=1 Tax=Vibrio cyclitrophicus TaxID=47951 RepID=UPI0038B28EF0
MSFRIYRETLSRFRAPLHPSTKYYTTYMPGRHGTLVGNANTSGGSKGAGLLTGPGLVTRDFMEKVLTGWGNAT